MLETALVAFMTFVATIGPLDTAAMFAAMTTSLSPQRRRSIALRGTAVATIILTIFAFVGEHLLTYLGISLAALRVAGGILLLLIGIEMVFARPTGGTSTTREEAEEAASKEDISVFPLATPLIAGPGAMGAAILLMANTKADIVQQLIVLGGLYCVLLLTLVGLLLATQLQRIIGVTAMHVISRVFGIILCALAVQFVFDGVAQSGLLQSSNPAAVQ